MFIFLAITCFLAVVFQHRLNIDAAILGLSLSMLIQLAGIFQVCVWVRVRMLR